MDVTDVWTGGERGCVGLCGPVARGRGIPCVCLGWGPGDFLFGFCDDGAISSSAPATKAILSTGRWPSDVGAGLFLHNSS
ncbi:hypothetical protein Mapa_017625 [Marchantia paleacea]|nr:hypothetical protein Mapa_017625 [Marchantia paleacea]